MPSCCQGASCACKMTPGTGITITGTGTSQDPFIVTNDRGMAVTDTTVFNLTLSGSGTAASPWTLQVDFAATAKLTNIPDVNAVGPTNGQVLGWDSATSKWTPRAPTTAASGSVLHDTSLTGDGSVGTPLAVVIAAGRFIQSSGGIGMTDAGINQLVRRFVDATARVSASPVPVLNALSTLDSKPGEVDYWNGTAWGPILDSFDLVTGTEFLSLSGSYSNQRLTYFQKQLAATTDPSGLFDMLTPADVAGRTGVLMVFFQETGSLAYKAVPFANTDRITATAFKLLDGSVFASQLISGTVFAWLY